MLPTPLPLFSRNQSFLELEVFRHAVAFERRLPFPPFPINREVDLLIPWHAPGASAVAHDGRALAARKACLLGIERSCLQEIGGEIGVGNRLAAKTCELEPTLLHASRSHIGGKFAQPAQSCTYDHGFRRS